MKKGIGKRDRLRDSLRKDGKRMRMAGCCFLLRPSSKLDRRWIAFGALRRLFNVRVCFAFGRWLNSQGLLVFGRLASTWPLFGVRALLSLGHSFEYQRRRHGFWWTSLLALLLDVGLGGGHVIRWKVRRGEGEGRGLSGGAAGALLVAALNRTICNGPGRAGVDHGVDEAKKKKGQHASWDGNYRGEQGDQLA